MHKINLTYRKRIILMHGYTQQGACSYNMILRGFFLKILQV